MPDLSDERPERWWALDPAAPTHQFVTCAICGTALPLDHSIPVHEESPLCAVHAGAVLSGTPVTAEYARWIEEGDPRWWSAWLCNCPYCKALEAFE